MYLAVFLFFFTPRCIYFIFFPVFLASIPHVTCMRLPVDPPVTFSRGGAPTAPSAAWSVCSNVEHSCSSVVSPQYTHILNNRATSTKVHLEKISCSVSQLQCKKTNVLLRCSGFCIQENLEIKNHNHLSRIEASVEFKLQ